MTNNDTGGNIAMTVNTEKKTVIAEGLTIPYREQVMKFGLRSMLIHKKAIRMHGLRDTALNRIICDIEQDFMTIDFLRFIQVKLMIY